MAQNTYSDKQVREAALLFLTHGNRQKVSDLTKIPLGTLADWITGRKGAERWQKAIELASKEADSDRQAMWQSILKATADKMTERIELGDPIIKDGKVAGYKPVALRDIGWIHGVITDKLRVSEGKATSITGKPTEQLNELAKLFDDMVNKNKSSKDNNAVIDSTTTDKSVDEIVKNNGDVSANKPFKATGKKELH